LATPTQRVSYGLLQGANNEHAILKNVVRSHHNWVTFVCSFDRDDHKYDFEAPDKSDALQVEKILKGNIGKSLLEIGEIEVPSD
jgi:hypothetical protein